MLWTDNSTADSFSPNSFSYCVPIIKIKWWLFSAGKPCKYKLNTASYEQWFRKRKAGNRQFRRNSCWEGKWWQDLTTCSGKKVCLSCLGGDDLTLWHGVCVASQQCDSPKVLCWIPTPSSLDQPQALQCLGTQTAMNVKAEDKNKHKSFSSLLSSTET